MVTKRRQHGLEPPQLLDLRQVAGQLCTCERRIRSLVAERRIPFVRVGRFVRFDPSLVTAWLESTRSLEPRPLLMASI